MNEGQKFDQGKEPMDLLPAKPLAEISKVFDFGAQKYGRFNWMKGMSWSRPYSAAMRHLIQWNDGENKDQESGLSHLAHAICNLMFLLQYKQDHLELDDRWQQVLRPKVNEAQIEKLVEENRDLFDKWVNLGD